MKMKMRRTVCGFLAAAIALTSLPFTAIAETEEETKNTGFYNSNQYVLFATGENSLQLNTSKTTLNGNLYSGGNLDAYSGEVDVNGETILGGELRKHDYTIWSSYMLKENSEEYVLTDFSDEFVNLLGDYYITHEYWQTYSGTDVDSDTSTYAKSGLQYCGNNVTLDGTYISDSYLMISASQALTTSEDSETNLYVKDGNIGIYAGDISLNGVIYAPNGSVQICGTNVEINGMIIAKEIMINAQNLSMIENYNLSLAPFIQCYNDQILAINAEFTKDDNTFNIALATTLEGGEFNIYYSSDGENYISDGTTDATEYELTIGDLVPELYIKATQTYENGFVLYSNILKFIYDKEYGYVINYADTDNEGLYDILEHVLGTDIYDTDTDDDGISDYHELLIGTNPLYPDSDDNGTLDGNEDYDGDKLTNSEEEKYGTAINHEDTDNDGLSDYEEIFIYGTDPLMDDTDGDGIIDGDEIALGLDPMATDSDGDGINDSDEKIQQTFVYDISDNDGVIEQIIVESAATNRLQSTTSAKSIMDIDILCSDVVGLIGEPFEIETTSKFDTATLSFKVDKNKLGSAKFENLIFLWYDEKNDQFVEMETEYDFDNSIVKTTTEHFSKYMIVDKIEWYQAWSEKLDYTSYNNLTNIRPLDTVFVVDCSPSMADNDPIILTSHPSCDRITAIQAYISTMEDYERGAIVKFGSTATAGSSEQIDPDGDGIELTGMLNKSQLNDEVYTINNNISGTDFGTAIKKGIDLIESDYKESDKIIIFMSDGNDFGSKNVLEQQLKRASNLKIKIYTIGFGDDCDENTLESIANATSGEYLKAISSEYLRMAYSAIGTYSKIDFETDNDHDNLPDVFEYVGIRLSNGRSWNNYTDDIIYCNPNNPDTDGDGILDGQEITYSIEQFITFPHINMLERLENNCFIKYTVHSYPNGIDSDDDGLLDNRRTINTDGVILAPVDPDPMVKNGPTNLWKSQTEIDLSESIPSELGGWFEYEDMNWFSYFLSSIFGSLGQSVWFTSQLSDGIRSPILTAIGAKCLNFRMDSMNVALHSQVETWQKIFGYNDLCDLIFSIGTLGNMDKHQFDFYGNNSEKYVLWIWRGDYLNFGGGAEMGIYQEAINLFENSIHFNAADFKLPMTLSLYDYGSDRNNPNNIFRWAPTEKQWWITGFAPNFTTPDEKNMAIIGSVDFSDNVNMYNSFVETNKNNLKQNQYLIFDDELHTVWIMWWGGNAS